MTAYGDELGFIYHERPRILQTGRGPRADFSDADVVPREGYRPPTSFEGFSQLEQIGLDIEAYDPDLKTLGSGARRAKGYIVGTAIAYSPQRAVYYPTAHANRDRCVNEKAFYDWLRREAADYRGEVVGANLQYDLDWLATRHAVVFPHAAIRDVQIAEPLLDENRLSYKLELLAREYVGEGKASNVLSEKYGKDYISNMHRVDPGWAAVYAEQDAVLPLAILAKQRIALRAQGLTELFDLESRLTPLLLQMKAAGVRVDFKAAERARDTLREQQDTTNTTLRELTGSRVDVWSADSIARAFKKLDVPFPTTATGRPSFTRPFLESCKHEIARLIVASRGFDKIAGTFLEAYILDGHINGRLHCTFNQLKSDGSGTVSGRFSSSNPNLQNIPARHPVFGPLCRSVFIPEEDHDWGSVDWSQIEYRLLVHYASITPGVDARLVVARYREDPTTDYHEIAAEITGKDRKVAKNINFGVVYGMGVDAMASQLNVTPEEARAVLDEFHGKSPYLRDMYQTASARASRAGYIRTILGRRRRFEDWESGGRIYKSRDDALKGSGRPRRAFTHKALNALLQGSAADLMKKAMVEMYEAGLFNVLVPHLTVHDEMNVSVPRTKAGEEAFAEMVHIMETSLPLEVPVRADHNRGANWNEAK